MNSSKINDPRSWMKWRKSGAVSQPKLFGDDLVIDATCEHYEGSVAAGHTVLSLGRRVTSSGPGWSASVPVHSVIVPGIGKYRPGQRLAHIPGNAMPLSAFFPNSAN